MSDFPLGFEHSFGKHKRKCTDELPNFSPKRLKLSQYANTNTVDDIFFTTEYNEKNSNSNSLAHITPRTKLLLTNNPASNEQSTIEKHTSFFTPPFQERSQFFNQNTKPQQYNQSLARTSTLRDQLKTIQTNILKRQSVQQEDVLAPKNNNFSDFDSLIEQKIAEKVIGNSEKPIDPNISGFNQTLKSKKASSKSKGQTRKKSKRSKNSVENEGESRSLRRLTEKSTSKIRNDVLVPSIEEPSEPRENHPFYQLSKKLNKNLLAVKDFQLEEIFSFKYFNPIQSACFEILWNTSKNMIISAPTGSGKTVLFEIAISRYIIQSDLKECHNFKVIYVAPIKALCQQKFSEWNEKFSKFNLKLLELTGDTEINDFSQYEASNIIITTPEKWDSITRKWKDNYRMVSQISLLLIDEVHLLNTEERGATLEAVVSRMKIISKSEELQSCPASKLRIIAVSATIPNIRDLGEWLEVPPECVKEFGDEYRSTPIEKHVFGYNMPKNEFQFEKSLNYRLMELIRKFSSGKPTLIFCQTQKGTISACEQIITDMRQREFVTDELQIQKLIEASHAVSDKNLQRFITYGVAFHNAGMSYDDRKLVEELFIDNLILIICTTSTLAMGVNLPARLVIIKSTVCYRGAGVGYTEYSPIEIEQMMGRAGRPQFDDRGVVVIMTDKKKLDKYKHQFFEKDSLESHLFEKLAEHINAEISLRCIKSLEAVVSYLKSTFYYIRMKKNPLKYGITVQEGIDEYLVTVSKNVIQELHKYEMIQYSANDGKVRPLELGIDMSRYYVSFMSMKNFYENHSKQDLKDLLTTLSEAQEFEKFRSRQEERKSLSNLNLRIKFPLTGAISSSSKKVFVLIQCGLGNVPLDHWELKRQINEIMNTSWKIMHCFKRLYSIKKLGQGLINSIKLIKFISMRTWEDNNMTILKQLPGIGDKFASALCDAKLETFDKLLQAQPYMIEMACNKNPPFGVQLQKKIEAIPQLNVQLIQRTSEEVKFQLSLKGDASTKGDKNDARSGFYFILEDRSHKVEIFRYFSLDEGLRGGISQTISISLTKETLYPLYGSFLNERYVGIDFWYTIHEDGSCFRRDGEQIIENIDTPQLGDSEKKKVNKSFWDYKEDFPSHENNFVGCSHKCKDKKKCKHACCKIGLEELSGTKIQQNIQDQNLKSDEKEADPIDENMAYIDTLLETAGKGKIQTVPELPILDQYSPIFTKDIYTNVLDKKDLMIGNKKLHQSNLFSYMTTKKYGNETASKVENTPVRNKERAQPVQNDKSEYCMNLLEKLGFSSGPSKNTKGHKACQKSDPNEQFQQLFGNIFE